MQGQLPDGARHAVIERAAADFRAVTETADGDCPAMTGRPPKPAGGWFSGCLVDVRRRSSASVFSHRMSAKGTSADYPPSWSRSRRHRVLPHGNLVCRGSDGGRGFFRPRGGGTGADGRRRARIESGHTTLREIFF